MERAKEMMPLFKEEVTSLNALYEKTNTGARRDVKLLAGIKFRLNQIKGRIKALGKKYNVVMARYYVPGKKPLYRFYTNIHMEDAKKIFDLDLKESGEHVVEVSFTEIEPGKNFIH